MIEQIIIGLSLIFILFCLLVIAFCVGYACATQDHTDFHWRDNVNIGSNSRDDDV